MQVVIKRISDANILFIISKGTCDILALHEKHAFMFFLTKKKFQELTLKWYMPLQVWHIFGKRRHKSGSGRLKHIAILVRGPMKLPGNKDSCQGTDNLLLSNVVPNQW
jgi:hypothetical protein